MINCMQCFLNMLRCVLNLITNSNAAVMCDRFLIKCVQKQASRMFIFCAFFFFLYERHVTEEASRGPWAGRAVERRLVSSRSCWRREKGASRGTEGGEASSACTEDRQPHKLGMEAGLDGQGPGAAVHRCSCLVRWQKGRHFIPTWKDNDILEAINKSLCLTDSLYSDKYESVSFVKPVLHLFKSPLLKVKYDVPDFTHTHTHHQDQNPELPGWKVKPKEKKPLFLISGYYASRGESEFRRS